MALIHSLEKNGNILFKFRGQIPLVLFIMAIPVIYFTDYKDINSNPTIKNSFTILAILISFFGQYIRAVAIGTSHKETSGRNTQEQVAEALNTKGIYSTLRHPLYLGNYFMWIGIIIYTYNFWFFIICSLLFWLYYERIMFAEERFLERKFGENYVNWSNKIPAFVPSFKNYEKSNISFSLKTILRREYSGVSATIIGFLFIDVIRDFYELNSFVFTLNQVYILIFAILLSLILRTFKHHTKILHEEDRS